MADNLMSLEDASKQLQLSKDQIVEMVKKGTLRGFLDQKTYKFRPADIEAYRKRLVSSETTLSEGPAKGAGAPPPAGRRKDATAKIDLSEIASDPALEPEGDEKDQTSVLAPLDEAGSKEKPEGPPVFQFSEKDLGLQKEPPALGAEGDQTSLMMDDDTKTVENKKETAPSFDFEEKNLPLPLDEESGESVLVADESESSVDILEVTEESSSESGSSASGVVLSDESSSGEGVKVPTAGAAAGKPSAPPAKGPKGPRDTTVTDILGAPGEDSSDEAMETLEVDEVVETREAVSGKAPTKPGVKATPETVPISEEYETVGLPAAEETKAAVPETGETAGVSGAVADALAEATGEEEKSEEEEEAEEGAAAVPAAWETVTASALGNGFLIAAIVMLLLGGIMLFCEAAGVHNGLVTKLVK